MTQNKTTYIQNLWGVIKKSFLTSSCIVAFIATTITVLNSALIDFEIYYEAGRSLINKESVYQFYGGFSLPFQYFPWASWPFAALAVLPIKQAWGVFASINIIVFYFSIILLSKLYDQNQDNRQVAANGVLVLAASLTMSLLVFVVGQISILLLFFCVLTMKFLRDKEYSKAGLLVPFLLIKPHLVLIFLLQVFRKGGKALAASATASTLLLLFVSTLHNLQWPTEMFDVIRVGQSNRGNELLWGFSTLAGALELSNWRIANFYFAVPSFLIAVAVLQRMDRLPLFPQLAFALALSLFAAPYSFAYDFPLLVPALVYITNRWKKYAVPLWVGAAIVPIFFQFQGQSYLLILAVVVLILVTIIHASNEVDAAMN